MASIERIVKVRERMHPWIHEEPFLNFWAIRDEYVECWRSQSRISGDEAWTRMGGFKFRARTTYVARRELRRIREFRKTGLEPEPIPVALLAPNEGPKPGVLA